MTNEEKLKRIEELESQILFNQKEISNLKDSIAYGEDFTGRYYHKKNTRHMFAKVIDGKSDACLVLQFELQENLYDEDVIPVNNEFSLNVYLSWMQKRILESYYIQINPYENNISKIKNNVLNYILEHFS
jgi:hypothetical protein